MGFHVPWHLITFFLCNIQTFILWGLLRERNLSRRDFSIWICSKYFTKLICSDLKVFYVGNRDDATHCLPMKKCLHAWINVPGDFWKVNYAQAGEGVLAFSSWDVRFSINDYHCLKIFVESTNFIGW